MMAHDCFFRSHPVMKKQRLALVLIRDETLQVRDRLAAAAESSKMKHGEAVLRRRTGNQVGIISCSAIALDSLRMRELRSDWPGRWW